MVPLHTEMARHSHHGLFLLFTMSWRIFIFIVACIGTVLGWTQETQIQSLGQEDPLEKELATYSSIVA